MKIIGLIISVFACLALQAQTSTEALELIPTEHNNSKEYVNEIGGGNMLKCSLNFYKKYISSQDASSCSFSPSCSEYAAEAIKKQGLIKGLMNFADRFQRCNASSPEQYEYIKEKHLLYDPVLDIRYKAIREKH